MRHRIGPVAILALAASATSGCASEGYDAGDAERRLREAGYSGEQAACVVEELDHDIGFEALNTRDDPTARQRETFVELLDRCGIRGD